MIRVGSEWVSTNHTTFIVRGVEQREDGLWVSYGRHGEDRTYECLVDAFFGRFKESLA